MANPEHIEILKRGVSEWNEWRGYKKPEFNVVAPDLSGVDFEGCNFSDAILFGVDLSGANLNRTKLVNANFALARLDGALLNEADLTDANLECARLISTQLQKSKLDGANLKVTELRNANLEQATLFEATLYQAVLVDANLREANLMNAFMFATNLSGADLTGANLSGTTLIDVNVDGANFEKATVGFTTINHTDLSNATGLELVIHRNPLSIGIDTIYLSKGNIPEVFLRKGGVPENFITYMHSLTGAALEFYTCFISFSEADDAFSERLYNDLLAAGVRCWRWKEDARWGETLMKSIDEAVRIYDKLVVICSERALHSPAVIREIERALQKEDELAREGKNNEVLFPIRLDDYVIRGWEHHRKADVLAKNIGDFRNWRDSNSYQNALHRLIRDLRAS